MPSSRALLRALSTVTAASALIALAGCSTPVGGADSGKSGTWTVLTYSIADTDLEPFMMTDLEELGSVGSQDGLTLVSLVDRSSDYSDEPVLGLDDWSGGKLLEVGQGEATVLEDMGDINTGDPQVLADFIARGVADYPADHYALVISDHGASWPGVGADGSTDDDTLTLAELHDAIADGTERAGIGTLDLLGFDACLMATYEVASTLAPVADRLIASQELEPGHGWDYRAFDEVADDGRATADELGAAIIDTFKAQATDEGTDAEITLSMIDLTRMGEVDAALAEFTTVLVDNAQGVGPTVGRTLAQTLGFGKSPDPDQDTYMTDLSILTGELGVELLFASDAADALVRAINDVVLDRVDGQATKGATGLSIYFPPTAEYFDDAYRELPNSGGWIDFLDAYYSEGADIAAGPTLDSNVEIGFDSDGVTITGYFDSETADNLASSYIRYGTVADDGSITFLGEEDADLGGDGSASSTYDLTSLLLSDGEDTVGGYLTLYGDETGVYTADVPLNYYSPEGDAAGELLLSTAVDSATGEILSSTYYQYDPETGNYGEFTPEPDWIIAPTVLTVLPDGTEQWTPTTDVGLYADRGSITYDFAALPSGTRLYLEITVVDFGGNEATASGVVTVP